MKKLRLLRFRYRQVSLYFGQVVQLQKILGTAVLDDGQVQKTINTKWNIYCYILSHNVKYVTKNPPKPVPVAARSKA